METTAVGQTPQDCDVYIVTGLSGAGKTSVMRALEDAGLYCVDNLPVPLMATFVKLAFYGNSALRRVALGIDVRNEHFLSAFLEELEQVKQLPISCKWTVIFVDARDQTLYKRFQETRRKHPLADGVSLEHALLSERRLLAPLQALADIVIDTDVFTIHDLRRWVNSLVLPNSERKLIAQVVSFGFKYGMPTESNVVYDVRFLPNPYFVPALKALTGQDRAVHDYVFSHPATHEYWQRLVPFLEYTLQRFHEEGRFNVTVAIGCTGGKHRSVAFVEKLTSLTLPQVEWIASHRDLGKE